jgi:hypothetical protein
MNAKKQKFILLRADGLSFDKIAKELKVSKAQLIQWSKIYEDEIKEIQFHAFLQIKEAYSYTQKSRYENLLKQLDKLDKGILEADLSTASIKDLFTIKNNILMQLDTIEKRVTVDSKVTSTNELGYKEQLQFKLNEAE